MEPPIQPQTDFRVALERFEAKTLGKMDVVLRKVAFDLLGSVVAGIPYGVGTPVDTGRARGGWQVGIDNDPMGDPGRLDQNGQATIDDGGNAIQSANAESVVYISNNVEYIAVLEAGWSKQAPAGMVGVALAALAPIVEKAVAETISEAEAGGSAA